MTKTAHFIVDTTGTLERTDPADLRAAQAEIVNFFSKEGVNSRAFELTDAFIKFAEDLRAIDKKYKEAS